MTKAIVFSFLALTLAACGGGGADLGVTTATPLAVSPANLTLTGSLTQCPSGVVNANFYVTGGEPPYSIKPSLPDVTILSTDTVGADGSYFTLTQINTTACLSGVSIAIEDKTGAVVNATITTQLQTPSQ